MGGDTFGIEISGPGNAAPKAEVTDNDDGCASCNDIRMSVIIANVIPPLLRSMPCRCEQ